VHRTLASQAARTLARTPVASSDGAPAGTTMSLPVRGAASRVPRSGRRWPRPETPCRRRELAEQPLRRHPTRPSPPAVGKGPERHHHWARNTWRRPGLDRARDHGRALSGSTR
jgi:hypothetical protein